MPWSVTSAANSQPWIHSGSRHILCKGEKKKKKTWKRTREKLLWISMSDKVPVHNFKGPHCPRKEKDAHLWVAWSCSDLILLRFYLQYGQNQLPWPPVLTFNYISTLIFFIPIIRTLATILPFWCLSPPFPSCEMSRNTFLNDVHDTPFD